MSYQSVLSALADPTRRRLFERLRRRPHCVGELARAYSISQPAVSQHLKVLRGARLVTVRPEGTRRYYQATPGGLLDLRAWLEGMWDDVLSAYARDPDAAPEEEP
jgi:DNA-binding transcriptional ArsR family regulator